MTDQPRTSDEIREAYIAFFREKGHQLLPPWPLVPIGDPTSMFTSAGMQQFKPIFMGEQQAPGARAVTVQRCFRTTDIEVVGDRSHCTAFEMMGNFSFGDYFKKGAIEMAWELLTQVYQLDPERLHATVYLDDEDAYEAWLAVGCSAERIHRRDEDLNYWFSFPNGTPGASGPLGPDSEIYYDLHPEMGEVVREPPARGDGGEGRRRRLRRTVPRDLEPGLQHQHHGADHRPPRTSTPAAVSNASPWSSRAWIRSSRPTSSIRSSPRRLPSSTCTTNRRTKT
ncbi:MAG: hypothetical protein IPI85_10180 [Dehalococcoidia bacterium]|nr:hypothetical protein [Dehalococcoidia bacterium]